VEFGLVVVKPKPIVSPGPGKPPALMEPQ
jgi:hypothetical protein